MIDCVAAIIPAYNLSLGAGCQRVRCAWTLHAQLGSINASDHGASAALHASGRHATGHRASGGKAVAAVERNVAGPAHSKVHRRNTPARVF